jgi:hypothetical protein
MQLTTWSRLAVAAGLAAAVPVAPIHQSGTTFTGTTPCNDLVRAFVGMPAAAPCPAIRWNLTLGTPEDANRWRLTAEIGSPRAGNAGVIIDGPRVTKQGTLASSTVQRLGAVSMVFRLTGDAGSSIAFARVGDDLVNLALDDGSLVPGTGAYSYTLTRADRVEPRVVEISRAPEGSYTLPPQETGAHVFGIFGGRSPCAGLARELKLADTAGWVRVKWRVTLLKDPATNQPTTYRVDSSLTRERGWTGTWRIVRGAPGFPDANVYQLDGDAAHGPILLLRLDDNLVLFLDQQRHPLPGTPDFSYTLSRLAMRD